jgi:acyl-CoA reductase-like NAD-dependent aldehyde dehydrogenase
MTTARHMIHASLYEEYVEWLAAKADLLAVGDPHREQVHLGPVNDEAVAPFGGTAASGTGARFGGEANLDAFTDLRWTTVRGDVAGYPF